MPSVKLGLAFIPTFIALLYQFGGVFGIYELLPAFIFSSICIVVVSLLTAAPSKDVEEDFEAVRTGKLEG